MTTRNLQSRILYCSRGIFHPSFLARKNLKLILTQIENSEIFITNQIAFETLIDDYHPQLIILYFHLKSISKESLYALIQFVEHGGSILAVHSASASFKQEAEYRNLLGGKFSHHGPIQEYEIRMASDNHMDISQQIPSYRIKDELYLHEYSKENEILLEASIGDQTEPVAWVKSRGKGKIMYYAPGHRAAIFKKLEVQNSVHTLIKFGLDR